MFRGIFPIINYYLQFASDIWILFAASPFRIDEWQKY